MKFLFTVQPMFGHFHAMVPLARAALERGHEVAFATGKRFGPVVQRAGFRHFACGFDFDGSRELLSALPEWEAIRALVPPGPIQQFYGFILGLGPRMADDLIELVKTWPPDVIIRDPLDFGGYIAAEMSGLPHASVMWAFYIAAKHGASQPLLELRQRYGLPDDPDLNTLDRYLLFDWLPASWAFPHWPPPPVTHHFCAPPFDQSGETGLPDWLETLPPQPTVYATLGTTFNQAPATFRAVVDAFLDEKINLILTVGSANDPAQFQPPVPHIKVARYIPQTLLLPRCDAVIFHGGFNSLHSALWHGLPLIAIPQQAGDQMPTAVRCAEVGVGVMVAEEPPAAEAIHAAVKTVLEEPGYRTRARQLQNEMKALPPLSEAVKRLEMLAVGAFQNLGMLE